MPIPDFVEGVIVAVDTYALTSLVNAKAYLNIATSNTDYDTILESCIDRASDWIESYCDRKFLAREYYEWHDGTGQKQLRLNNSPIIYTKLVAYGVQNAMTINGGLAPDLAATVSVENETLTLTRISSAGTEVTSSLDLTHTDYSTTGKIVTALGSVVGWSATTLAKDVPSRWLHQSQGQDSKTTGVTLTYPPQAENEYRVDTVKGIVYLRSSPHFSKYEEPVNRFPRTRQSVLVWYKAGYASVPDDIEQAALEFVAKIFTMREHDPNVSSEGLGDYNYSLRPSVEVLASISQVLQPHKDIR